MKSSNASLIFLGTGTSQGIPVIGSKSPVCLSSNPKDKRLRSSVFVKIDKRQFLIDCGPDFRLQMLNNKLSKVNAIFFTHEHNDHMIGLDDVRPIFFNQKKNIDLYGLERTLNDIKCRFAYAFKENAYPGVPKFELHPIQANEKLQVDGVNIQTIGAMHGNLPILGYRFKDLAYLTDISSIPEESLVHLQNLKVLILNVLRKQPKHNAHLVLDEALELAEKLKPKQVYFTHISHHLGFHDEVQTELPENVSLAYDGLEIKF